MSAIDSSFQEGQYGVYRNKKVQASCPAITEVSSIWSCRARSYTLATSILLSMVPYSILHLPASTGRPGSSRASKVASLEGPGSSQPASQPAAEGSFVLSVSRRSACELDDSTGLPSDVHSCSKTSLSILLLTLDIDVSGSFFTAGLLPLTERSMTN